MISHARVIGVLSLLLAFLFMAGLNSAHAALLFDRGLPTANLNNAAGSNRSNTAWADQESYDPGAPGFTDEYWLMGDDFSIKGSGQYRVTQLTVWSLNKTGLSLWLGPEGGTISQLSSVPTATSVKYADSSTYQGSAGAYRDLYRLDFSVNLVVDANQKYQFFLDGPWESMGANTWVGPFLHASNSALSVSSQAGADNFMLALYRYNASNVYVDTWNSAELNWDKSSDANILVQGAPVPIPGALWLLGSGLLGLIGLRRRIKM